MTPTEEMIDAGVKAGALWKITGDGARKIYNAMRRLEAPEPPPAPIYIEKDLMADEFDCEHDFFSKEVDGATLQFCIMCHKRTFLVEEEE